MNVIPQQEKTSVNIREVAHNVRLSNIRMCIKTTTTVAAPGNFSRHSIHDDIHSSRHDLQLGRALGDLETPIVFSAEKRE